VARTCGGEPSPIIIVAARDQQHHGPAPQESCSVCKQASRQAGKWDWALGNLGGTYSMKVFSACLSASTYSAPSS